MIKLDESTEETQKILEEWRSEAKAMTFDGLSNFLQKITKEYQHDYGMICHAISIGGVATMYAISNSEQGDITGFQAGAIMWENIQNWDTSYRGKPLKLMDYSNMLYPHHQYRFEKTITLGTKDYLRKEAKRNLSKDNEHTSPRVVEHWKKIARGEVPFGYTVKED